MCLSRLFDNACIFPHVVLDFSIGTLPISITFAPSDNMQPVPLQIIEDVFFEGNEIFTLSLSLGTASNTTEIGQSTSQVTIEDNDSRL